MRIVALSDTHAQHKDVTVPDGDVLVFAGDLMTCGRKFVEVASFANWFMNQSHRHKILVAGNHDRVFESNLPVCLSEFRNRGSVSYLQDSGVIVEGVNFWGSPYQPWFYDWAFNVPRGTAIAEHWAKIPKDTDVLITHGPAYGVLDQAIPNEVTSTWSSTLLVHPSEHVGCEELRKVVDDISPKVHIFGHIHGSYGSCKSDESVGLFLPADFYNVSICDEQYNPVNPVTVIDLCT